MNFNVGLALYDDDVETFVSVLKSFLINGPDSVKSLKISIATKDKDSYIIAHGLKGITASIGAEKLSAHFRELELLLRDKKFEESHVAYNAAIEEYRKAIVEINEYIQKNEITEL